MAVKPLKARKNRKKAPHSRPTLGFISTWLSRANGLRSRFLGRFLRDSWGWVSGSRLSTTKRLSAAKPVATQTGRDTATRASCPPTKGPRMNPKPKATPIKPKARARLSGGVMSASTALAVAAVPPLMPSMIRAANNNSRGSRLWLGQGSETVTANRPSPTTDPATQMLITGRRP